MNRLMKKFRVGVDRHLRAKRSNLQTPRQNGIAFAIQSSQEGAPTSYFLERGAV